MNKEPVNVIIPLGGLGKRFAEEGFIQPKPLVKVLGRSIIDWVLRNLDLSDEDMLYLIYHKSLEKVNFESVLRNEFPHISFTKLVSDTKGAAETVYRCSESIPENRKHLQTICLDGDTFYHTDIINQVRSLRGSGVVCFRDDQNKPIYSYVELDNKNIVKQIAEKKRISDFANTGCYFFESASLMEKYCNKTILEGKKEMGEYYISTVLGNMLKDRLRLKALKIGQTDFVVLGTPYQVKLFANYDHTKMEKLRICFDIDNTILNYPSTKGNYATCTPINHNLEILRFLKQIGHTIILYTARRMRTHSGNIGAVVQDVGKITIDTLEKYSIPYDEIYFGKPYAHFYIDDLAINTSSNIEKEMGIYRSEISERSFNKLEQSYLETITKTSDNAVALNGEIHWYENMPSSLKDLFPRYYGRTKEGFQIEKVRGVSLSHIYLDELMTTGLLSDLISSIDRIHSCEPPTGQKLDIYSNYSSKLKERYNNHDYSGFPNSESKYSEIMKNLEDYESNSMGELSVIHGDPVFTNIIVKENQDLIFIDMRGSLGGIETISGDKWYDYSKIYQSLIGYDEILLEKFVDQDYKSKLISHFNEIIMERFGEERLDCVKQITSSLLFTLIPLHDDSPKLLEYFELI